MTVATVDRLLTDKQNASLRLRWVLLVTAMAGIVLVLFTYYAGFRYPPSFPRLLSSAVAISTLAGTVAFYASKVKLARAETGLIVLAQQFQETLAMELLQRGFDVVRPTQYARGTVEEAQRAVDIIARRGRGPVVVDVSSAAV